MGGCITGVSNSVEKGKIKVLVDLKFEWNPVSVDIFAQAFFLEIFGPNRRQKQGKDLKKRHKSLEILKILYKLDKTTFSRISGQD